MVVLGLAGNLVLLDAVALITQYANGLLVDVRAVRGFDLVSAVVDFGTQSRR